MVSNTTLVEYYERHKTDYPVVFDLMDDGIVMKVIGEGNAFAYLEGNAYQVYPSDLMPYVFINSLKDDAKTHQFEFDENDPRLVLDVFVNCVYLQLNRIRNDVENLMSAIEGRK